MDGATPLQLFRLVFLPLMAPSLVAVGTYALLLAWNEYLYAFLLLSNDRQITLAVALGNFLAAVRSRRSADLNAEILEGHLSSALCHTGNISYRLGRASVPEEKRRAYRPSPRLVS